METKQLSPQLPRSYLEPYLREGYSLVTDGTQSLVSSQPLPPEVTFTSFDGHSVLLIPHGNKVLKPFHLTCVDDQSTHSQFTIRLEPHSSAVLILKRVTPLRREHPYESVVNIRLGIRSHLTLIELQQSSGAHRITRDCSLERNSVLEHVVIGLDGSSEETTTYSLLEPDAQVSLHQAVLGLDKTKRKTQITARHLAPRTQSQLSTRSVAGDTASVVSHSNVLIEKTAQQSTSQLTDHSLIINDGARAESIPGMEVLVNDVRAGHSASTHHLNNEHLFYLMSRGLDETTARKEIVLGFLQSVLPESLGVGALGIDVRGLLAERFQATDALHRNDFPALLQKVNGHDLVYLDNAATTQKPRIVIDTLKRFYENDNANIHRGLHTLSERATRQYDASRKTVASFIGAQSSELIFVRNTTEGINLLAQTLGKSRVQRGDVILLTEMEHHSNIVPWQLLAQEKGAALAYVKVKDEGTLDLMSLEQELQRRPKILALTHVSNVLGTINPLKEIIALAHKYGTLVVVDGAQSVPHLAVDVFDLDCDAFVFSGHKMYGPTGIGCVYVKRELLKTLPPYMGGGGMIKEVGLYGSTYKDGPERFEAGTPPIAGAIALASAVEYLRGLGMDVISSHERKLTEYALQRLREIPQAVLYGPLDSFLRAGVISFNLGDIHAHDVSTVLDERGIAVRAGHHCAQPLMERLKAASMCRVSFALYTGKKDIDAFISALRDAVKVFRL